MNHRASYALGEAKRRNLAYHGPEGLIVHVRAGQVYGCPSTSEVILSASMGLSGNASG
jgi:hypothetical protein